jgi:catechol 2,3-dioxygenase-like lactoylglutathione lyase family enzyme
MELKGLTLTSRDLLKSRAFYVKLGFAVVAEERGRSFAVDAGGIRLHVDQNGPRSPLIAAEPRLRFRTAGLAARCTELRDLGVSVDGPRQPGGEVIAELADPDGHPIVLCESV